MELALVLAIDAIAIIGLLALGLSKGVERALPFAVFLLVVIPIESIIPLGLFTLTTHRIIVGILATLYFTKGAGAEAGFKGSTPLKIFMIVSALWCVVATINSIVPGASVKKLLSVVLEYYLLYFVVWKTVSKIETAHKIFMAVVLGMAVCSVWGVGETYAGWNIIKYFPTVSHHWQGLGDLDREVRIHVTYDHPILYGAMLAMGITFALYLLTVVQTRFQKAFLWVSLMLMFFNIYKTSSRGPWLDAIIGSALILMLGGKQTRRYVVYLTFITIAVCIIRPGVWDTIVGLYKSTFSDSDTGSSYQYRYALQDAAVQRLSQDPTTHALWGYGPESFFDVHLQGTLMGRPWSFTSCDNAWVEFMVETGFIGFGIMVAFLLKPLWMAWRGSRKLSGEYRNVSFIIFVNLVIFYFQMYSVGMYAWGQNGYMLWIIIALTPTLPILAARDEQAEEERLENEYEVASADGARLLPANVS